MTTYVRVELMLDSTRIDSVKRLMQTSVTPLPRCRTREPVNLYLHYNYANCLMCAIAGAVVDQYVTCCHYIVKQRPNEVLQCSPHLTVKPKLH
jgi:hypothetical protein